MTNVITDKPVATTGVIGAIATGLEAYAEHRGWIPAQAAPLVIGATVAVLATIAHELVTPYKRVKAIVEDGLHITDADFGRVEAVLSQYGLELIAKVDAPDPAPFVAPAHAVPDGMSAGDPTTEGA